MSILTVKRNQLGTSATATNNFTLTAEAADGTMKIAKGNAGATSQDILTVNSSNNAVLGSSSAYLKNSSGQIIAINSGFKNKIINGGFDLWQRGTSQTTAGYGSADRWYSSRLNSTNTITQTEFTAGQTVVSNNPRYYARSVVALNAGGAIGDYAALTQRIEDVTKSSGKTVTLSFWAKANTTKNLATEFVQYFGTGGSPSAQVQSIGVTTHALTASWQKFTVTTTIPSVSGKTLGTDGNDSFQLNFWFDAGSSLNARTNTLGHQTGTFDIAQVQLEYSSVATEFESRPYIQELRLCQRYYQIVYTSVSTNMGGWANSTAGSVHQFLQFNQVMRVTPSVTGSISLTGGTLGTTTWYPRPTGVHVEITGGSAFTAYQAIIAIGSSLTADSEL